MNSIDSLILKYHSNNHFGNLLGVEYEILSPGEVVSSMLVRKDHLATPNSAHGGLIAAFVDGLLGFCGLSAVAADGKVVSTVEFKINYFKPAFLGDQLLGKAKIDHKGSRILVISAEVFVKNRDNLLISKAMGTFNSYPAEKAGY